MGKDKYPTYEDVMNEAGQTAREMALKIPKPASGSIMKTIRDFSMIDLFKLFNLSPFKDLKEYIETLGKPELIMKLIIVASVPYGYYSWGIIREGNIFDPAFQTTVFVISYLLLLYIAMYALHFMAKKYEDRKKDRLLRFKYYIDNVDPMIEDPHQKMEEMLVALSDGNSELAKSYVLKLTTQFSKEFQEQMSKFEIKMEQINTQIEALQSAVQNVVETTHQKVEEINKSVKDTTELNTKLISLLASVPALKELAGGVQKVLDKTDVDEKIADFVGDVAVNVGEAIEKAGDVVEEALEKVGDVTEAIDEALDGVPEAVTESAIEVVKKTLEETLLPND